MKIFTVLAVVFILSSNAHASDLSDLLNGSAARHNSIERKELARKMNDLFLIVSNSFPSLKPSEQKWIDEEKVSINSLGNNSDKFSRLVGLHESVEFQQYNFKNLITSIFESLNGVNNSKSIKEEMYYWSLVSYTLTDKGQFDGAIAILIKGNKLKNNGKYYFGGEASGGGYFYNSFGRAIQEYYVIPYLRN